MLVPIRSYCFTSTMRSDLCRDFHHYNIDQSDQAVADAMSWWELIKDFFNDFNHAKALTCLFYVVKYQNILRHCDLTSDEFQDHHRSLSVSFTALDALIDDGYMLNCTLCRSYDPWLTLCIQNRNDLTTNISLGTVPAFSNNNSRKIWNIVHACETVETSAKDLLNLLGTIEQFSGEVECNTKSRLFKQISAHFPWHGWFSEQVMPTDDGIPERYLVFKIGDEVVGECWLAGTNV
jgi:hypothetical protein